MEVRRSDDDELCGYVMAADDGWHALTLFHGVLAICASREDAEREVVAQGLASLARRWQLVDHAAGSDEVVCIQEAWPGRVVVALTPMAYPGAPTRTLTAQQLATGSIELRLA